MKITVLRLLLILVTLVFAGCALLPPDDETSQEPPQISVFSISPTSIESGQSAVLSWEVSGALSVTIEPYLKNVAFAGSQQVYADQSTEFTIIATNESGDSKATVTLSVKDNTPAVKPGPPVIISFEAQPNCVVAGAVVVLSWEVTNVSSISIEWGDNKYDTKEASDSLILEPYLTTVCKLTAKNTLGSSVTETTIIIEEAPQSYHAGQGGSGWGGGGGGGGSG